MLGIQVLVVAKAEGDHVHCAQQFSNGGRVGHMFRGVSIHETLSEDNPLINL